MSAMVEDRKNRFSRVAAPLMETFGLSRALALAAVLLTSLVVVAAVFWFFHSAPPHTITITGGPPGSTFETNAWKYAKILASNGVTLRILPSQGSLENLQRLQNPSFDVDIGFVQGGVTNATNSGKLISLGSISYQPLLVFYRCATPVTLLSDLKGKRLAIGPVGSGTRSLALTLLELNGFGTNGPTTLVDLDAGEAAKALLEERVDAVFLMGDSASTQIMRQLMLAPGIQLLDFKQADGYTRRVSYLNRLELPEGSIDFGKNIPAHDLHLIGPTVELLARSDLHPALSDLLLEAAREVHGSAKLLQRKGEFPAPLEHDFPISPDATRYYKSGKSFLYRSLPFWLASLSNRILVAFVPLVVVLIPGLRIIPALYKWRMRLLIYRRYRALLTVERDLLGQLTPETRKELLARIEAIEKSVNNMKVPASFGDQFYGLRGHIRFVRDRLVQTTESR
jgi:TRAP transporter TAXI family solute receptor